jgi:transcriptional regulator with XRE-family HTH domain
MVKNKLVEQRTKKSFSQRAMADALCMDVANYNRRENGLMHISLDEWKKLATILEVPLDEIYEADENLVFIFNDNATGNGNIVTNYAIPQYILDIQKKYVETLEEKIKGLEMEIFQLKNI